MPTTLHLYRKAKMPKTRLNITLSDEALAMLDQLNIWHKDATGQANKSMVLEMLIREAFSDKSKPNA